MIDSGHGGEVEFRLYCPDAHQVYLVGDFNDWDTGSLPMKRGKDGNWYCRMRLPEGIYHFKYLADGEWYLHYSEFGVDRGPFGCNSIFVTADSDAAAVPVG